MASMQLIGNPRRRRKSRKSRKSRSGKRVSIRINPRRRHRIGRRRRNPMAFSGARIQSAIGSAIAAATGAVLLDAAWANLPIPAQLKTGAVQWIAKGVGAILIGQLASSSRMVSRETASLFTLGALTVMSYGLVKNLVASSGVRLGYYAPGYVVGADGMSGDVGDESLGMYLDPFGGSFPEVSAPRAAVPRKKSNGMGTYDYNFDSAVSSF